MKTNFLLVQKRILWPQCYRQWVSKAPLCITLRIKTWVEAYLKFIIIFLRIKKENNFILCNFLVRTLQSFQKFFLPTKSWKKPSKVAKSTFFSLVPWAAQTAQTEEFMFQNVAYRPTIYRTGPLTNKKFVFSVLSSWKEIITNVL